MSISGAPFTEDSAWNFVADKLSEGHPFEEVSLKVPHGKRGYVLKIEIGSDRPLLYVKLQIGMGTVIGRSFHYTDHCGDEEIE
ncbi:hypothetical protein YTPLAS18_33860 [Nitrospira sp.]|nr:hypothetical protein YTPLAS18_33860 [Nitrospira sp.]